MTDVLLLADIWENFKSVCYNVYKSDVSYYYTSPGLSWDAFLKCMDKYNYYMKNPFTLYFFYFFSNILKLN